MDQWHEIDKIFVKIKNVLMQQLEFYMFKSKCKRHKQCNRGKSFLLILRLGEKFNIIKNLNCISFPESRYINSYLVLFLYFTIQ